MSKTSPEISPLDNIENRTFFHGNLNSPVSSCIVIASHLSKINRVPYLFECLDSLLSQTIVIPIYLSISFETHEINCEFAKQFIARPYLHNDMLYLYARDKKTPQMRHMFELFPILKQQYHWIFFCDDDDTYQPTRVEHFLTEIQKAVKNFSRTNRIVQGAYESHAKKDHRHQRHEFWSYCINMRVFEQFYNTLNDYPEIVDQTCCDILFAEYLRRHSYTDIYVRINSKFYNYRTNDAESVTGEIQNTSKEVRQARKVTDENRLECASELNAFLDENIHMYLHDVFLFTIVGQDFDFILQAEFKSEYCIRDLVRPEHIEKMQHLHTHLKEICDRLYAIKLGN